MGDEVTEVTEVTDAARYLSHIRHQCHLVVRHGSVQAMEPS